MAMLLALLGAGLAVAAPPHIAATLEAESRAPKAGSRIDLAIAFRPAPTWHGYWKNPGDAGTETLVEWTLPAGVKAGELRYPVPGTLLVGGIMNHVYEAPYALLVPLDVPAGLAPGTQLPIRAKVDWLACTREICVPERATLSLDLTVGDGAVEPAARTRFDGWRAALPRPLGAQARFERAGETLRLAVPLPASAAVKEPWFFPLGDDVTEQSAPQRASRAGDALVIEAKVGRGSPERIEGVVRIGPDRGLAIVAVPGKVPAGGAAAGAVESEGEGGGGLLLALGGALLGGLLLNVMPCVFPILSLKALSLARGGGSAAAARREALAYTGGAVIACVALGAALLGVRAGGAAAGWAFQLTDPRMIAALLLLSLAIALNLAGLFELPSLSGGLHAQGAFATGALAAFVATPCTGPFMAAALGAALVLPWVQALAVFAGLGLGLALPFLLIGFVPALRRALPKPGPWMATMRHILSVPMFVTALALAWLLGRQAGADGMAMGLAAALALALGLWWVGQRGLGVRAWLPLAPALAVSAALILTVPRAGPAEAAVASAGSEPFSEAKLAALTGAGTPVFVYFTADWCLTCKVNEKAAIERSIVRDAFAAKGIKVLVGDWTQGDAAIGRFLESQGRSGVPLYLFYAPGRAPQVLPQLLTPGLLTGLAV
ncbi:protein-disulfide reductase DsbD family protein [Sphingomonas jatrophae]|nr:protein-disulfide reductase DsbD domain-containing protein [Sphingomonas jatrophae]